MKKSIHVLLVFILLLFAFESKCETIKYVTAEGSGLKDGTSWQNALAFTELNTAIDTAKSAVQFWVARGDYSVSSPVTMRKNIKIYGGFVGTESQLSERKANSRTNLIGDGDVEYIVSGDGGSTRDTSAVLDGFVISNALTAGLDSISGLIANCDVVNNLQTGVYCNNGVIRNCTISQNTGDGVSGGTGAIVNCQIIKNGNYGILSFDGKVIACNISQNSSGIYSSKATCINCVISKNSVGIDESGGEYINCTVIKNYTGVYNAIAKFTNCILLNEYNDGIERSTLNYCAVLYGSKGTYNITLNENSIYTEFVDALHSNYHLKPTSILLNKGTKTGVTEKTDFDGKSRIYDSKIDLGAFEYGVDLQLTVLNQEDKPVVDALVLCNGIAFRTDINGVANIDVAPNSNPRLQISSMFYADTIIGSIAVANTAQQLTYRFTSPVNQTIIYLTEAGQGSKDGSSWENALPLDSLYFALDNATVPAQIWVQKGNVYKPTSLKLREGVAIYGGFTGDETQLSQRQIMDRTLLYVPDAFVVYTVVQDGEDHLNATAILDGFVLTNNFSQSYDGVSCEGGVISNCSIINNGGEGVFSSTAYFINCMILNNTYRGVYMSNGVFTNCVIAKNKQGVSYSSGMFTNCTIANNREAEISNGSSRYSNCIVWGDGEEDVDDTVSTFVYSGMIGGHKGYKNISLSADNDSDSGPHFLNPKGSNYRIYAGSPCIDAAADSCISEAADLLGNARKYGKSVDMGALEAFSTIKFIAEDTNKKPLATVEITVLGETYRTDADGILQYLPLSIATDSISFAARRIGFDDVFVGKFMATSDTIIKLYFKQNNNKPIVYVTPDATGNGYSWQSPIASLQEAFDKCPDGGQVWIAKGDYLVNKLTIARPIAIYGGFVGNETSLAQRKPMQNKTSIKPTESDSYEWMDIILADSAAKIDNVNIVSDLNKNLRLVNRGGTITSCTIIGTPAVSESVNAVFKNTVFRDCETVGVETSSGIFINCQFINFETAIVDTGSVKKHSLYYNCVIRDCYKGVECSSSNSNYGCILFNCNIVNSLRIGLTISGRCAVYNSIIWGNESEQIVASTISNEPPRISHCAIQGGYKPAIGDWGGNISLNKTNLAIDGPQFVDSSYYKILVSSPCLNVGDSTVYINPLGFYDTLSAYPYDITDSVSRIIGHSQDIGAMEYPVPFNKATRKGIVQSDSLICYGQSMNLNIDYPSICDSIRWSTLQTTANITVKPLKTTKYTLSYKIGMLSFNDSLTLAVSQPANLGKDTAVCFRQATALSPGIFKSYLWNDGTTAATHDIDFDSPKTYSVAVVDSMNCKSNDTILISKINPLPIIDLPSDTSVCDGGTVLLTAPLAAKYEWSTKQTTQSISVNEAKKYIVKITDTKNCYNSDSIELHTLKPFQEQIGMIGYDSLTGVNVVVAWNKHKNKRTERFVVYREGTSAGSWDSIGGRTITDTAMIIDRSANLDEYAYKYKLQTIDSVCHQRAESTPHRTMHVFTSNSATNNSITLEWNAYIGFDTELKSYSVLRYEPDGTVRTLKTLAANGTSDLSFSDLSPMKDAFYRIAYSLPEKVSPLVYKADTGPFSQSFSNMSEASLVDVAVTDETMTVTVAPNPAKDKIIITAVDAIESISLIAADGQVAKQIISNKTSTAEVQVSDFARGFYLLVVNTASSVQTVTLSLQ